MKGWVIFATAFALYFVSIFGGFIQDDTKVIQGDSQMGQVSSLASVWTRPYYYREGEKSVYRPVTSFSFYLNALITGNSAWGFRMGNVLIYASMCWLTFLILSVFTERKKAFWMAMIFAVLPVHTEAVNNIVGRAELLSLGFLLLSIWENTQKRWDVSALFLLLGLLSKETAIAGVPILLYLAVTNKNVVKNDKWGASILAVMAVATFLLLRLIVLGTEMTNFATVVENPLKYTSTKNRVRTGISLIPFGVEKIIFPVNLSYDYSYNQIKTVENWSDIKVLLGIFMFIGSASSLFIKKLRENKLWIMGNFIFWVPILITGNILFPIGTIFGERLWFLPSFGLVLMVGSWVSRITKKWEHLLMAILLLYTGRTFVRNLDWLSQERLFIHDANYVNESVMAVSNKAAMLLNMRDLENGKRAMEEADKIYPLYPELLNNWGLYYFWTGDKEKAVLKLNECLKQRPGFYLCKNNLELINRDSK